MKILMIFAMTFVSVFVLAQSPFQTMKDLYDSTQTPVAVTDFTPYPGADRWSCWIDSAYDASGTQIQKIYLGTLDKQINGGPLFPDTALLVVGTSPNMTPDPSLSQWVKNTCSDTDLVVEQLISQGTEVRAQVRKTTDYVVGHYFLSGQQQQPFEAYFYCATPQPGNTQP